MPTRPTSGTCPGVLAPLRLLAAPDGHGGMLAVVHHRVHNTYTAVARVTHPGLALLASAQAQHRVQGWASWLAQACAEDGAVCRIGTYHAAEPGEADELAGWAEAHVRGEAPAPAVELVQRSWPRIGARWPSTPATCRSPCRPPGPAARSATPAAATPAPAPC